MTDFLRINGIPLAVLDGSAGLSVEEIGGLERAVDGTAITNRRAVKGSWGFTLAHSAAATALAWRDLLLGRGHRWAFDSHLYSSKGLGPSSSSGATISATQSKFGGSSLKIVDTGSYVAAALPSGSPWTVLLWRYVAGWKHYAVTSAGTKYEDGVAGVYTTTWLSVSSGSVTLANAEGADRYYDDLVVLPCIVPATWPASVFGYGAAFSPLAKLYADGLAIEAGALTKTVRGSVGRASMVQATSAGAWASNLHVLDFTLTEV